MFVELNMSSGNAANSFVIAASEGDYAEVKRRIDAGSRVNEYHDRLKYTALHAACDVGSADVRAARGLVVWHHERERERERGALPTHVCLA